MRVVGSIRGEPRHGGRLLLLSLEMLHQKELLLTLLQLLLLLHLEEELVLLIRFLHFRKFSFRVSVCRCSSSSPP